MFKKLRGKKKKEDKGDDSDSRSKGHSSKDHSVDDKKSKKNVDKSKKKLKRRGSAKGPSNKETTNSTLNETNATEAYTVDDLDLLRPIPTFYETSPNQKISLFVRKLKLCCVMFNWSDEIDTADNRAKEIKRQQLLELVEFIGKSNKNVYTDEVLSEIITMVSTNLFRTLPPAVHANAIEAEEEDPVFEPCWPHLQIVYEFFLRFIVSSDVEIKVLKRYITGDFVLRILELFDSEDHRERDYLKTILHRIYAKFMSLRAFIRKAINNVFYSFIYSTGSHNGVSELLEILGSIINGFALPLKQEHKIFLTKVLTPMHQVPTLAVFHQQLSYCVTQFVDKDPELAIPVLRGLIRFWPLANSSKEVLFLNELEELLELTQPEHFRIILDPLFHQLSRAIGSPHFQVAERALFIWHNEYISGLIADHRNEVLPILFPVLHINSKNHWNPTVNNLTLNVLKIFMELDSLFVEQISKQYAIDAAKQEADNTMKVRVWKELEIAETTS